MACTTHGRPFAFERRPRVSAVAQLAFDLDQRSATASDGTYDTNA